jgi:hypothetical protein
VGEGESGHNFHLGSHATIATETKVHQIRKERENIWAWVGKMLWDKVS